MDNVGRLRAGGGFLTEGGNVSRFFGRWSTNHAPVISSFEVTGTEDTPLVISRASFAAHFTDPHGDAWAAIKVVSLPATGARRLAGMAVTPGRETAAVQLDTLTSGLWDFNRRPTLRNLSIDVKIMPGWIH
jgi:hypothetical protein